MVDHQRLFAVMVSAFQRAWDRYPDSVRELFCTFAEQSIHFRIVGCKLAENIGHPFSHLQAGEPAPTAPQLSIDLWDENETDIRCQVRSPHGTQDWSRSAGVSVDGWFVAQRLPNTLASLDRQHRRIVGSIAWSEEVFGYERGKPLDKLLVQWYNDQQVQVIHAGLVAWNHDGILLAGRSGSGKSTTALACACGGFDFLGEDYIGLQRQQDGSYRGHSLYSSVFLDADQLARFPELVPYALVGRPAEDNKATLLLSQVFPERLKRSVPIRALVVCRVTGAPESRVRAASKGEAVLALGPSSLLQIPSRPTGAFANLARLAEQLPCYWLDLGRDLESIPRCVRDILVEANP
jgi:hypothetical protein